MMGYLLEQAEPTQTRPPYILSKDPEDPIFYSTCYIYKSGVQWLPTIKQNVKRDWAFNTQCLECSAYEANEANNATTPKDGKTPKWLVSRTCTDCNNPTLCWKDCPYKLPDGTVYNDTKTKKPHVPAPKEKPSYRKKIKHSFHMVGITIKEASDNMPRITKAIAAAFSVDASQVKILEVISISGVYDDRRRRGLLSRFMGRGLNHRRRRYLVAFRVKVVYEIYVIDDAEARRVELKMTDQKTNVELATNIEKETGLTTAVEASGEAPQIEAISDNNDNTPGNNKSDNTGVIVIVAIGSACVCLAFAFGFYKRNITMKNNKMFQEFQNKRKGNTKMNNNKMFQESQDAVETKSVVEAGLHTAAVPIQLEHCTVISTSFGDGDLLYERPFDNAKVIRLKWGLLYQINA